MIGGKPNKACHPEEAPCPERGPLTMRLSIKRNTEKAQLTGVGHKFQDAMGSALYTISPIRRCISSLKNPQPANLKIRMIKIRHQ